MLGLQNQHSVQLTHFVETDREATDELEPRQFPNKETFIELHLLNLVTVSSSTKIAAACLLNLTSVNSIVVHSEGWLCAENILSIFL